uniref:Uncharacterized protein n=1 Tax=Myoviridae sp. ct6eX13 TaxID=2827660 RepID=A0A8S5T5S1_9CAUD|nr:MAG TPA: hypothetical protein [Myoviridae sp. ct6eX13]
MEIIMEIIMERMKAMLFRAIELLARMSGYDSEELMDIYFQYVDECQEAGEPCNWDYFVDVTMERDW